METAATSKSLNYNANQTTISSNNTITTNTDTGTGKGINTSKQDATKTETLDLTSEVEQKESKGFFETIGDGLASAGGAVVNGFKSVGEWAANGVKEAGATIAEAASSLAGDVKEFASSAGEWLKDTGQKVAATGAVIGTSVVSGVAKLGEKLSDGLEWVGGKVVEGGAWVAGQVAGAFSDDAKENIDNWRKDFSKDVKEDIARDKVGEMNEAFYEGTDVGKWINAHSAIKYDSEIANKIQGATTVVAEVAAATALTVCTGGAAAPFVVGALVGAGKAAESTYQKNGTDTTFLQELGIAGSGALTGLTWVANGKLGQGALEIGKDIVAKGGATVLKDMGAQMFNKEFIFSRLKDGLSLKNAAGKVNINAIMNYGQAAMGTAGSLTPYITGEEKFDATAALKLGGTYLGYLGLNVLEDTARDYVSGYKATGAATKIVTEAERAELEAIPDPVSANSTSLDVKTGEINTTADISSPSSTKTALNSVATGAEVKAETKGPLLLPGKVEEPTGTKIVDGHKTETVLEYSFKATDNPTEIRLKALEEANEGKLIRGILDETQQDALASIGDKHGVKIEAFGTDLIPGTNLPVNSTIEIDGVKYYINGNLLDSGKVDGGAKHIWEQVDQTLNSELEFHPEKVDEYAQTHSLKTKIGDEKVPLTYEILKKKYDGNETKIMNELRDKIKDAYQMEHHISQGEANDIINDILNESGLFEDYYSLNGLKNNLRIAGIDAGDLNKYTIEELQELNGRAVFEIYIRGLKNYHRNILALDDFDPGIELNKSGIPTWVNAASEDGESFMIEIITRDSTPGDIGDKQLFHFFHGAGEVTMEQSARQQGVKLLTDGIRTGKLEYNLLDRAIDSKSDLLPETLEDFKMATNKAEIISEIIEQLKQKGIEKITTSTNAIADDGYRQMAVEEIQKLLKSEDMQEEIEKLIMQRYSGTGNKYKKALTKIADLLTGIFKGGK